jgi:sugar (pentulose or hexulose) kinase
MAADAGFRIASGRPVRNDAFSFKMSESVFIAVDLGAGSGRVMAARTDFATLEMEEVHRFGNPGIELPDGIYWDILGLYREILHGLRLAVETFGERIVSIGIDSWAVDFALLDGRGSMLAMPHQYRDPRFEGMAERMHGMLPEEEIFRRSGIKTNFYNTSLQLLAESARQSPALAQADRLLFIPDLLAYWLTGVKSTERTNASTSQLLDPVTGDWAWEVIDALGLPRRPFGPITAPGTVIGRLSEEVATRIGRGGIPVVATASHDTAAAVAGIPMTGSERLWLSSGTWSIMGMELDEPITSPQALAYGFCNELGVAGSVRFLKNIGGLWLIQECKRQWELDGDDLSYAELADLAAAAEPFTAFIDPDDPEFAAAGRMPEKIRRFCERTGQPVPQDKGAVLRVATDSLALKYRLVFERLQSLTGRRFSRLHMGGGGIQNALLNQSTANALGVDVVAGPVEATSCGNVITQMVATGHLPDIAAGRELIRRSFASESYHPADRGEWSAAYDTFCGLLGLERVPAAT